MNEPRVGDRVKAKCTATGAYIGNGMVLFVSAMDNDIALDGHDPEGTPWEKAPMPSRDEVCAAAMAYRRGLRQSPAPPLVVDVPNRDTEPGAGV